MSLYKNNISNCNVAQTLLKSDLAFIEIFHTENEECNNTEKWSFCKNLHFVSKIKIFLMLRVNLSSYNIIIYSLKKCFGFDKDYI